MNSWEMREKLMSIFDSEGSKSKSKRKSQTVGISYPWLIIDTPSLASILPEIREILTFA